LDFFELLFDCFLSFKYMLFWKNFTLLFFPFFFSFCGKGLDSLYLRPDTRVSKLASARLSRHAFPASGRGPENHKTCISLLLPALDFLLFPIFFCVRSPSFGVSLPWIIAHSHSFKHQGMFYFLYSFSFCFDLRIWGLKF
jgi:hypothetical protein